MEETKQENITENNEEQVNTTDNNNEEKKEEEQPVEDKKRKIDQVIKFDLNNLTVKLLKEMLSKKGLDDKGKKSVLVDRLKEAAEETELEQLAQQVLEEEDKESYESEFSEGSSYDEGDSGESNGKGKVLDERRIKKLTFAQLKSYAKKKGLETKGKKEELLQRVLSNASN
eukprot:TRINITY_DN774_c0_g1_i1.p1 TRINITY_DN774_c0_g1~~TRINITY_DN774_c0_g1_i1.p1  ORF type:complete len:171 (-),score=77.03 TRINITY_DN774_c0_g1_i1:118-630(-)